MKTMTEKTFYWSMKLVCLGALVILALGLAFSAHAATPVAVWDGDFTTATKGGWTLSSTGSTITDEQITVGTTPITMTPSATQNGGWYTVVYKVKGLKNTSQAPIATWGRPKETSGSWNDPDLIGAFLDYDYVQGVWNGSERAQSSQQTRVNLSSAGTEEHRIVVRYHSGVEYGVWAYVDGTKVFTADKGLKASIDVNRMTILGFQYNNSCVLKGAVVTGLAIFSESSNAGDAAYTSYMFPSELSKMYSNRLSGDTAVVTPGTYGAITVPGAGYKATAYTAATQLPMSGSDEEVSGSYATIIRKPSGDTDIYVHTFAGWFKIDALPTATGAAGAKTIYAVKSADDNYGGYKVAVGSDGKIYVGQCDNEAWRNDSGRSTVVTTAGKIEAGKWFHLAVSIPGRVSARTTTATIFFNGEKVATSGGPFGTNLNGNGCSYARIGEKGVTSGLGISAAGIYVDTRAIDNAKAVISAANGFVVAAPYQATVTTSANWANLAWVSGKKPTSGADVKLIRSGDAADAKVTIDEDVRLAKLTVASASGKSLTLKVDNTLAATTYDFSGTVTIGGAGRVEYTSASVPTLTTWTWVANGDDAWTGTFAWSGFSGTANNWNPTSYYNGTKSKFEFDGTVSGGYFWLSNAKDNLFGELVLKGSITFNDGYTHPSGSEEITHYCFTKLSGSKNFTMNTSSSASPVVMFADGSDYTGTISIASSNKDGHGYCVTLGDGYLSTPAEAAIHLTGNVAIGAFTLSAKNGVKIADDVSLVFADKDSKLTVSSAVAVNSGVTIPVKIADATDLTAGTALITWTSQPAGSFSLVVGSGVEKGTSGFKASKNSTSLTAIADTTKTYYEVEGGKTTTTFENSWLETAGVKGDTTDKTQANLNAENANGIKMSDVYLMGYEAADAQNAAVILKPSQAQSNGESISLSVAGVPAETRNGAVITYTALANANRDWTNPTVKKEMDTRSVDMALPTSGVLYYRVQATVALP